MRITITCRLASAATIGVPIVFSISRRAIAKKRRCNIHKMPLELGIDLEVLVHGAVTISNVKICVFYL